MAFITYKQHDSRWGNKNYNGSSTMAQGGCGPTACAMILYGVDGKTTPLDTMKYMQTHGDSTHKKFALYGQGTAWNGITQCLKDGGLKDVQVVTSMSKAFDLMSKGYVGLFRFQPGKRGGVTWTTAGHYIAVTGYKEKNGKHYIYTRDSGSRNHTGWYCYETTMKGLLDDPAIWLGHIGDVPKKVSYKHCIDTSYWQGKHSVSDWKKVRKSCTYAIHRATYTSQDSFSLHDDSTFLTNFKNSQEAGLICGAYHYSQAKTVEEAKKEAEYLCKRLKGLSVPFYVVCDYEFGGRLNSKTATHASDVANAFCDVVKSHGYRPCIYVNLSTIQKYLTKPKHPIWIAQYNSSCSYKGEKVMWQYTSSGSVDGISGKVDLSYVYAEPKLEPTPKPSKYGGEFPDLVVNCRNYLSNVAKDLAYAKGTSSKIYNYKTGKAKESFTRAIKKVYGSSYYKWSKQCRLGASCDVFVGTVVRYSGCDTKYPRGLDGQIKTSPKHCAEVKDIKAGDIMRYLTKTGGHTRMIVDINGTLYFCEANHDYKGGQYGHIGSKATAKPSTAVKNLKIFRCNSAFKAMSKGDTGSEVTKLQKFLKWAGFDCGSADGDFGDRTLGAVKNFQLKVGLTADGEFGSKSLAKAKEYTK